MRGDGRLSRAATGVTRTSIREGTEMAAKGFRTPPDEVDKAVAAAKKVVGRLAKLLGDEDPTVLYKAASALAEIGPFVLGPLEGTMRRTADLRHRLAILVQTLATCCERRSSCSQP